VKTWLAMSASSTGASFIAALATANCSISSSGQRSVQRTSR
jgi:hypothetical protein